MDFYFYNPFSKNGRSKAYLEQLLVVHNSEHVIVNITNQEDIMHKISLITDLDNCFIVGGDGTIHIVINLLIKNDKKPHIYITKGGSGNDLYKSVVETNKQAYFSQINVNNQLAYFSNGCGIGFDGLVCNLTNNDPKKSKLSYYKNVYKALVSFKKFHLDVEIDGNLMSFKKVWLCSISNGQFFGAGMKIAPKASIYDKEFDICIVHNVSAFLFLLIFPTVLFGIHPRFNRYVYTTKANNIKVLSSKKGYFQMDGEIIPKRVNEFSVTTTNHAFFIDRIN